MTLNYSEPKALPWAGLSGLFEAKHRIHRLHRIVRFVYRSSLQANGLRQASPGQARNERRPGICRTNGNKPQRGATNHASIPHVSFIDLDAMFLAERPELILIRHLAMVRLLRRDIGPDLLDIRLADGK